MQAPPISDLKNRVLEVVSEMKTEIALAVSALVKTASVSPNYPGCSYEELVGGETQANRLLATYYERAGCQIHWVETVERRANLVGVLPGRASGSASSLIFNGHIDVVPGGRPESWTDGNPFSGRIENGRVYGRGACDQKGGLVAQAMAAIALRRAGVSLEGDLILQSVVGEEVGEHAAGINAVIDAGFRADAAIVSEPTAPPVPLAISPVSAGLLWMQLSVIGKTGHNCLRPELVRAGGLGSEAGVNAIEKGVYLLTMLLELEQQWGLKYKHPLFKAGHFTLHPGVIVGGPDGILVPFMISDYCRVDYSILYPPQCRVEDIKEEIETFIQRAAALDPWLSEHPPTVEWKLHWEPYALDPNHPICKVLARAHAQAATEEPVIGAVEPGRISAFCAVCDATYLNKAGIPAVAYGPGSLLTAHAINEHVDIEEVVLATKSYALAAMEWCGSAR